MKTLWFDWSEVTADAEMIRLDISALTPSPDITEIEYEFFNEGEDAVLRLTGMFDATQRRPTALRVDDGEVDEALVEVDASLRRAMEVAASNIRAVAEAQLDPIPRLVTLPQGQSVAIREVAVSAAGIYAPGGRAAYPSSVLMCAIPAKVAGVERIALASPPGPDGHISAPVLAAAALAGVDEVYAMGGAQAIFALAYGTTSVARVDVIAGPGNAWVQEAKRAVYGQVGIDSYAGPSELMVIADRDTNPTWAGLDLCAQAEHGAGSVLAAVAVDAATLEEIADATETIAIERKIEQDLLLALIQVPGLEEAIELANGFAPEHLELLVADASTLVQQVRTAGCVFIGAHGATAFGDYVAGSNHVLPTGGTGRFSGPLGPKTFMRKIAEVSVGGEAAAKLAPHVDALARAEGFPVHGESAMIRADQ